MRRFAVPVVMLAALTGGCGNAEPSEKKKENAGEDVVLTPEAAREGRAQAKEEKGDPRSRPQVVQLEGAGAKQAVGDPGDDAPSPGAASDDEVRADLRGARRELRSFKRHLASGAVLHTGPKARVLPDGTAVAPEDAPAWSSG